MTFSHLFRTRLLLGALLLVVGSDTMLCAQTGRETKRKAQQSAEPSIVWVNELPDGKELPSGVSHRTFPSQAAGRQVGYCIYLPPQYESEPDRRFPVIYNLHGNGGNEFHSFEDVAVLDAGIRSGRWPALIMVLPNGGKSTFYKDSHDGQFPIETVFIRELIPHIDAEFRTIADRTGRCIEGFSMGGRGATRLALRHPDLFCSLFCQAGNVPRTLENWEAAAEGEFPRSYLGSDRDVVAENDVYWLLEHRADRFRGRLRIQIACGTQDGGHLPTIRDFHAALLTHGIDHTYIELEGLGHQRTKMIQQLAPIWFDYHVESLRRSGAVATL